MKPLVFNINDLGDLTVLKLGIFLLTVFSNFCSNCCHQLATHLLHYSIMSVTSLQACLNHLIKL